MTPPRLALIGHGKMGRAVEQLAREQGHSVVVILGAGDAISRETLRDAQVAVEFTTPGAAPANIRACLAAGCPVVSGTTGWYDEMDAMRAEVARHDGALLCAANFSVGVHIMLRLAALAGSLVAAAGLDAHIVETHHAAKRDAPSGTAKLLASTTGAALGRDVPVTSVRTGSVPGTHELIFDGAWEQLRIEHVARDRRVFADGALVASRWIVGKRGVFTMRDVLGAESGE